jgi:ATP-dependent DNA ligase
MKNLEQFPCIKPDLASGGIKREDDSSIIQKPASMWRNPEDWIVLLKYDGVRCIAGIKDYSSYVAGTSAAPHWKLVSRSDKLNESANLDWLRNELFGFSFAEPQLGEVVLDGEIWCPEYELGEINGYWSKQDLRAGWEKLQYRVFDCIWPKHPDMNYTKRMKLLRDRLVGAGWSPASSQIKFAMAPVFSGSEDTEPVYPWIQAAKLYDATMPIGYSSVGTTPYSHSALNISDKYITSILTPYLSVPSHSSVFEVANELQYRLDVAIAMDMEGIIIRKWDIPYQCERGGSNFYRFKNWPDSEFEIVGYEEGIGGFIGVPIWICETTDGSETFKVTAQGTMPEKNQKWIDRDKYVGEQVKVKYERLRDNGVPQKPISLGIRPAGS